MEIPSRAETGDTAALLRLTDRLYRVDSLDDVFGAALDAITELLGCERASILLFDDLGVMRFVAWRKLSDAYRQKVDGHTPWKPGERDVAPIFVSDIATTAEPDWLKQTLSNEGITGLGFVPLMAKGEVVGKFMTYFPEVHEFTSHERELAVAIARQVGFSLERYRADSARTATERRLRESEDRFRRMSEDAPIMIWISDSAGHCLHLNQMLRTFWGVTELEGFDWASTIHPDDQQAIGAAMAEAIRTRSSARVKGRYCRHDGVYRILETVARPNYADDGRFDGMIGVNVDVTEREEADQHKQLLINELNHRVKNTLAVVQSVARQSFKGDASIDAKVKSFEGRLSALAQTHNLLAAESWQSASLEEVVRQSVNGDADVRIRIAGPRVQLEPKQAVTTAMALHELYTNAVKHGALRSTDGTIDFTWQTTDEPGQWLTMRWQETCREPIQKPTRRGFGSTMIEKALGAEFNAEVEMNYLPEGLVCTVVARKPASLETR
ncbi:MAG: domain S-box protein [Devosia sp.]|uniref:sensor histidine kinase n=1 Tax=Devosia sp. TaxID=1871048 RepID=UPI0026194AD8|nr:HWE histidine kinase domain-containing protein [Devosia sp.]MDB5539004.1 domain S-box protein [Devosia sp.]